jgi:hypothetical protein
LGVGAARRGSIECRERGRSSAESNVCIDTSSKETNSLLLEEEEEEDLFVFNDTTEGPRAPATTSASIELRLLCV